LVKEVEERSRAFHPNFREAGSKAKGHSRKVKKKERKVALFNSQVLT